MPKVSPYSNDMNQGMRKGWAWMASVLLVFGGCRETAKNTLVKISGMQFDHHELEMLALGLPEPQREMVRQDSLEKKSFLQSIVEMKLCSLETRNLNLAKEADTLQQLHRLEQRIRTEFYYEVHLQRKLGNSSEELRNFYSRNPDSFRDALGRNRSFEEAESEVAEAYVLQKAGSEPVRLAGTPRRYLVEFRRKLLNEAQARVLQKQGAHFQNPFEGCDSSALRAYYKAHIGDYRSPETYVVYHIELDAPLDMAAKKIRSLTDFRSFAGKYSRNSWTRPRLGEVGTIKKNHCLPYGIGFLPSLFTALDSMPENSLSPAFLQPESGKWHWFWLSHRFQGQIKSFDRAKYLACFDSQEKSWASKANQRPVATFPDGMEIREGDATDLLAEQTSPGQDQSNLTREKAVDLLAHWEAVGREVHALGLEHDPALQGRLQLGRLKYWAQFYRQSQGRGFGMDPRLLETAFQQKPDLFHGGEKAVDYRIYSEDIAAYLALQEEDFRLEYNIYREHYPGAFMQALPDLFKTLKPIGLQRAKAQWLDRLQKKYHLEILDPAFPADNVASPALASIQDSICFVQANQDLAKKQYWNALAEYRKLGYLRPGSPKAGIALFKEGFVQAEYLQNKPEAERVFRNFLKAFPESPLVQDATWLLGNLEKPANLHATVFK